MIDLRTYVLETKKISSIDDKSSINDYVLEGFKLGKNKVKKVEEDFVDLELPSGTLWCKYNVGAACKSDPKSWYGDYFMWGDTEPIDSKTCNWSNYKYCNGNNKTLTKYCNIDQIGCWDIKDVKAKPDNKTVLDEEDDMVSANIGGDCKMPTEDDIQELLDNTTSKWVKNYNNIQRLNGRLFTSNTNGNTLFIPAGGYYDFNSKSSVAETGGNVSIWSSTLHYKYPYNAYYLNSYSYNIYLTGRYRCCGCPIRAIMS